MIIDSKSSLQTALCAGYTLTVTTTGTALISLFENGAQSGEPLVVKHTYPITVGPLATDSQWKIDAISEPATVTFDAAGQVCRIVRTTDAELPTYGKIGLIYETESGWVRWDELTGAYVNTSSAPLKPVAVEGEDPVISGDTEVGSVLTVTDHGGWTGRPSSYTYQWKLDGSELVGQTSQSYTTVASCAGLDVLCEITGVNLIDSADAGVESNAITVDAE